jgi:cobalt-zinc-cadmium efflux system outer membrane protein
MRRAVLCAGLAVVCMPLVSGAQSLTLTESQALARLSPDGPRVRAVRAPIQVAQAEVLAAGRWPNPRVSVERQAVAGVTEYYTSVSQLLPVTGRRAFDVQAASALVQARSRRADDEVRRLRADLRLAFADLVAAQARERQLTTSRDRLRQLSQVLGRRESAGDAAGFDRLRAEREVLDLESDLVIAATDRATAQARLAGFFGVAIEPSQIVAAERSEGSPAVPTLDALVAQAQSARGELAAFQHEVDAARLAVRSADRRRLPEPEVYAGTKSSTAGSAGSGSAVTIGSGAIGPVVGVQMTIPVFDRGKPERALAEARAAQAESATESLRTILRAEAAALREAVIQRRAAAEKYRSEGLGSAAEIERIAQVSYDAGERGILELLDVYRLGASARIRQITLDLAVRQAEIELGFTTGWEMPL